MIDIKDLLKEEVLKALYDNARVQGMGYIQAIHAPEMTVEHAKEILDGMDNLKHKRWDYLYGRVMNVNLTHDEFNPVLYDLDNGTGAAKMAIDSLRMR